MSIDIVSFTLISLFGGGMLIGLAGAVLMIFGGRIAGISGILGGLLTPRRKDIGWLITAPIIYSLFFDLPTIEIAAHSAVIFIAGLLVGFDYRRAEGDAARRRHAGRDGDFRAAQKMRSSTFL